MPGLVLALAFMLSSLVFILPFLLALFFTLVPSASMAPELMVEPDVVPVSIVPVPEVVLIVPLVVPVPIEPDVVPVFIVPLVVPVL